MNYNLEPNKEVIVEFTDENNFYQISCGYIDNKRYWWIFGWNPFDKKRVINWRSLDSFKNKTFESDIMPNNSRLVLIKYQMSRPIDFYQTVRYDSKNQVWRSFLSNHIIKNVSIKGWSEIERLK